MSFLLLRSQNGAMNLAAPASLHRMTAEEKSEWSSERSRASRVGRWIETTLWSAVMLVFSAASTVTWPVRLLAGKTIGKLARDTIGGAFQLGILYLVHDLVVAANTAKFSSRFAMGHRRFIAIMTLSLAAAFLAAMAFLFVNGSFSPTSPSEP